MKIKKVYDYSNGRQIWRLIPTDSGKIIIEDRSVETKEAYFSCLDIHNGDKIVNNFQLNEKYWVGIEKVYNDIIFFHKYAKPDMPGHKGIIAYDLITKELLWQTEEYNFLFIYGSKLYSYTQMFEGRKFYALDYKNGDIIEELDENVSYVNALREESLINQDFENYLFPISYWPDSGEKEPNRNLLEEFYKLNFITGSIELINYKSTILLSYHKAIDGNGLENKFAAIDILSKKIIFEVTLNTRVNAFVPDSYFVKDELLFLLIEKEYLFVYSLVE